MKETINYKYVIHTLSGNINFSILNLTERRDGETENSKKEPTTCLMLRLFLAPE